MEASPVNQKVEVVRDESTFPFNGAKNRTERLREVACSGENAANFGTNLNTETFESITLRVRNMGVVTVKKEPGTEEDFGVSYSLSSLLEQCDFETSSPLKQQHRELKSPTRLSSSKDGPAAAKPRKRLESVISSLKSAKTKDGHHTKKLKAPENKHSTVITISSPPSIAAAPTTITPTSTMNIIDTRLSGPKDGNVPQIVDVRSLAAVAKAPIIPTTTYKHTYVTRPQLSVQQSQGVSSKGGKQVTNIAKVNASGFCVQGSSNTQPKSVPLSAPLNIRFVLPSLVPFNKDHFQKALQGALASIGSTSLEIDPYKLQQAIQAALTAVITSTSHAVTSKSQHQSMHLPVTFKASPVTSSQTTTKTVYQHHAMPHRQPQRTTETTVSSTTQVGIPVLRPSGHFPVKVAGSGKSLLLPKPLLPSTTRPVSGLADSRQSLPFPCGVGTIVIRDHKSSPKISGTSGPSCSSPSTSQVSALQRNLTDAQQSVTRAMDSCAYSCEPLNPSAGASGIVATPSENSPTVKSHANGQGNSLPILPSMPATLLASHSPRDPICGVLEKSPSMNGGSASVSQTSMPSSVSMQSLLVSEKVALSSTAGDTQVLGTSVSQLGSQNDALSLTSCTVSTTGSNALSAVDATLTVSNPKISLSSLDKEARLSVSGTLVQSSSSSTSSGNSGSTLHISTNTSNAVSGNGPFIVLDSATYMENKKGPTYSSREAPLTIKLPISYFSSKASLPIMQPNSVTLNHASSVGGARSHSNSVSVESPTQHATSSLDDQAVVYTTCQSSDLVSGSSKGQSFSVQQSAVELPAASSAPHQVHLVPTAAQKPRKQRKALSKESGEQLGDCECEVCHQTHDVQNAVDVELGPDGKLKCKYTTCRKSYSSKAALWKHYYFHLLHGMKVPQEKASLSCDTFLPPKLSSLYRKARLRELFKRLTDEEIKELILPRLAKSISLFELLEQKSSRINRCRTISSYKMFNEFERFRKQVEQKLTEVMEQAEKDKNASADMDNNCVNEQETSEVPDNLSELKKDIGKTATDTDEPASSSECTEKNSPSAKPVEPEKLETLLNKDVSVNFVKSSCVETIVSSFVNTSSVGAEYKQASPISKFDPSLKNQSNYKGKQVQDDIETSSSSTYYVHSVESGLVSKNSVCADSEKEHPEFTPVGMEHDSQVELGPLPRDLCNCEENAVEESTGGFSSLEQHSGPGGEESTLKATTKETCVTGSVGEGLAQVGSDQTSADVNQLRCEETADGNRSIHSENKAGVASQDQEECRVIYSEEQRKVLQIGIENQREDVSSTGNDAGSSAERTGCNQNVTDEKRTKAVEDSDTAIMKPSNKEQAGDNKAGVEETKKPEERLEKQKDESLKTVATSNRTGVIGEAHGEDGTPDNRGDQTGQESCNGLLENASSDRQDPSLDPADSSLGSPFHSKTKEGLTSLSVTETANENESLAELDDEDVFGFRIPFMLKRAKLLQRPKVKYKSKSSPEKKIVGKPKGEDFLKFICQHPKGAAMVVLEATTPGDKNFFRNHVMPALLDKHFPAFSMLGQNLLSQLFLTRKDYERIFRWGLGPKLAQVLGINIFPTYKRITDFTKGLKTGDKGEDESSTKNDDLDADENNGESEMPAENDQSEDVYQGLPKSGKKRKIAFKPPSEVNKKQKANDKSRVVHTAQSQTEKKNNEGSGGESTVEISETSSAGIQQMKSSLSDTRSQHDKMVTVQACGKNQSGPPIEAIMHVDVSQFSSMSRPPTEQASSASENTSAEGTDQNSEEREPSRFPSTEKPVLNNPAGSSAAATCGISSSVAVPSNATICTSNAPSSTLPAVPLPSATGAPLFLIPVEKVSTDLLMQFIKSGQESVQADFSGDKSKSSVVLILVPSTSSTGAPTIQTLTSSSQLETSGGRKPLLLIPSEKVPSSVVGQSNTVRRTMIITMVAGSGSKTRAKTESTHSSSTGLDSQVAIASTAAGLQADATSATQSLRTPVMSPGLGEPLAQAASPVLTAKPVLSGVSSSATTSSVSSKVIQDDASKISGVSTSCNADDPKMSVSNEVKNLTSVVRNTSALNSTLESSLGYSCERPLDDFSSCTTSSQVTQLSTSDSDNIPLTDPSQNVGITVTVVSTVATGSDAQETLVSSLVSSNSTLTPMGDLAGNVSDFRPVDVVANSSDKSCASEDKEGATSATNACTAPSVTAKVSPLNPSCNSESLSDSDIDEQSFNRCEEARFHSRGDHTYAVVRRQSPRKSVGCFKGNLPRSTVAVSGPTTSEDSACRMIGHEYSLRRTSLPAPGSSKVKGQSDDGTPPRKRHRGPTLRSSVRETSVARTSVPDRVLRGSPSKTRDRK